MSKWVAKSLWCMEECGEGCSDIGCWVMGFTALLVLVGVGWVFWQGGMALWRL